MNRVCTRARVQAAANPSNTLYDVKRIIGQCFSHSGVQQDIKTFAFEVEAALPSLLHLASCILHLAGRG